MYEIVNVQYTGTYNNGGTSIPAVLGEFRASSAADLPAQNVDCHIICGCDGLDIATGDRYIWNGTAWILQPSDRAFSNVYTKSEIDAMIANYYTKTESDDLFEWITVTITTDTLPLTFKADGTPLISWSMKGNGVQSGTPTPDNPVMPEFVGARTANLCAIPSVSANIGNLTVAANGGTLSLTGTVTEIARSNAFWKRFNFFLSAGDYTIKLAVPRSYQSGYSAYLVEYDTGTMLASISGGTLSETTFTLADDTHVYIGFYIYNKTLSDDKWILMLNSGSTAIPYEPYGYKIPLTCAGQTTPLYLGEVSTVRRIKKMILDGTETVTEESANVYSIPISDTVIAGAGVSTHFAYDASTADGQFQIESGKVVFGYDDTLENFKAFLADQYVAGTPVTVWYVLAEPEAGIVNEPLCKIGTYADELHSTDAGVQIPAAKGSNTLSVDTTVQPYEVSITGCIRRE